MMHTHDPLIRSPDEVRHRIDADDAAEIGRIIADTYGMPMGQIFSQEDVGAWFDTSFTGRVDRFLKRLTGERNADFKESALAHAGRIGLQMDRDWVPHLFDDRITGIDSAVSPAGTRSSYKATYVDADRDRIFQLPKQEDTLLDRLEQTLTWQHNAEFLADQGHHPATRYDIVVTTVADDPYPVAVGAFHDDLTMDYELDEAEWEYWQPYIDEEAQALQTYVENRDIAVHSSDEFEPTRQDGEYAIDTDTGTVYVMDVGELTTRWEGHDTFREKHGITEKAEQYLDRMS